MSVRPEGRLAQPVGAGEDSVELQELAGQLRTVVSRLAFHLRTPATRDGITPTRLAALAALSATGPCRLGDLAAQLGIGAGSMSRLAEILEDSGWVRRQDDPDDHRACLVALTEVGAGTLDRLRRESTSWLTGDLSSLSRSQRRTLTEAIPVLEALADRQLGAGADRRPPLNR
jgi:DNA-binding MarR family transcriptional regulator